MIFFFMNLKRERQQHIFSYYGRAREGVNHNTSNDFHNPTHFKEMRIETRMFTIDANRRKSRLIDFASFLFCLMKLIDSQFFFVT